MSELRRNHDLAAISSRLVKERGYSALEKTDPDELVEKFGISYEDALAVENFFPKLESLVKTEGGSQRVKGVSDEIYQSDVDVDEGILRLWLGDDCWYNSHHDVKQIMATFRDINRK